MLNMAGFWKRQERAAKRRAREAIRRGAKARAVGMPVVADANMRVAARELDRAVVAAEQVRLWSERRAS